MTKQDWIKRGHRDMLDGLSRYAAKRWLTVAATVEQSRWYWEGYNSLG